jgi:hypothetical protein
MFRATGGSEACCAKLAPVHVAEPLGCALSVATLPDGDKGVNHNPVKLLTLSGVTCEHMDAWFGQQGRVVAHLDPGTNLAGAQAFFAQQIAGPAESVAQGTPGVRVMH